MLYFFDGSSGCDLCQAFSGIYASAEVRPHPHCECTVEPLEEDMLTDSMDDIESLLDDGCYVPDSLVISESDWTEDETITLDDSCFSSAGEAELEIPGVEDDRLGDLSEYAEAEGWIRPTSEERTVTIPARPGHRTVVPIRKHYVTVDILVYVGSCNPPHIPTGTEYGSFTYLADVEVGEPDYEPCDDRIA